jgi:hypothetical protein
MVRRLNGVPLDQQTRDLGRLAGLSNLSKIDLIAIFALALYENHKGDPMAPICAVLSAAFKMMQRMTTRVSDGEGGVKRAMRSCLLLIGVVDELCCKLLGDGDGVPLPSEKIDFAKEMHRRGRDMEEEATQTANTPDRGRSITPRP